MNPSWSASCVCGLCAAFNLPVLSGEWSVTSQQWDQQRSFHLTTAVVISSDHSLDSSFTCRPTSVWVIRPEPRTVEECKALSGLSSLQAIIMLTTDWPLWTVLMNTVVCVFVLSLSWCVFVLSHSSDAVNVTALWLSRDGYCDAALRNTSIHPCTCPPACSGQCIVGDLCDDTWWRWCDCHRVMELVAHAVTADQVDSMYR